MDAKRKALIAAGLVALWGGLVYWQWVAMPDPVHAPLANVSGKGALSVRAVSPSGGLRVHLEQLAAARTQREATFTTPRNIFAVPGSDGTLSVVRDVGGGQVSDQASDQMTAQALQQQAASLELAQYRYLGFMRMGESTNRNMAVLSKNDEVVVGRAGQHLERHLVVKSVTPESVTLRDLQARIDHTVPLTEVAAEPQPQP